MEEIKFSIDDKEYYIKPVDAKVVQKAQKLYNKVFRQSIEEGCLMKKRLDAYMREQGMWDDKREQEYKTLVKNIADLEYKLNSGGIKLSEARELALKLRDARFELRTLLSERSEMDNKTAEGQAENERFNFLVATCCYDYLTRKPVFSSYEEYLERVAENVAQVCASKFANYLYNLEEDYESSLAENKFLKRFKFVDDKGRLINKEGKLVDEDGNFVNEEGYRVDENGNRIDINNNPIPTTTVEDAEFIDDVYGE